MSDLARELAALEGQIEAIYNETWDADLSAYEKARRRELRKLLASERCAVRLLRMTVGRLDAAERRAEADAARIRTELEAIKFDRACALIAAEQWARTSGVKLKLEVTRE